MSSYFDTIFHGAMYELAVSNGSISIRLAKAYKGHLYKIYWDENIKLLDGGIKEDFLELKRILPNGDDVSHYREQYIQSFHPSLDKQILEKHAKNINVVGIIAGMHWRGAEKAAKLICSIVIKLDSKLLYDSLILRK